MSPAQCRAARGWLNWTQQDLADKASVGISTVRDFEAGRRKPIANNIAAMRRVIEAAGVDLIEEGGEAVGIRRRYSRG